MSRCSSWSASCSRTTPTPHNWIVALLATIVVVLLAQPVKEAVQNALDRVFYRDRYDYRRALVGVRARPEQRPRRRASEPAAGRAHRRNARRRSDGADARRRAASATSAPSATSGSSSQCRASSRRRRSSPGLMRATPSRSTIRSRRRGSRPKRSSSGATRASTTSCPAFSKASAIAVLALSRKETRRAVQQRRSRAAHRGRRPGGDGHRERPSLSPAASQGRGARPDARVQRQHPRVARRWAGGVRRRRAHRPLEPRAREPSTACREPTRSAARSSKCSTRRSSRRSAPRGGSIRTARRSSRCR